MQVVFSLRNVAYRNILSISTLDIDSGMLFGITGKSGSGKTTFLKLLNNMLTCDAGEVLYYGTNVLMLDPVNLRRSVMMVPQAPYIFPGSVLENIQLVFHFNRKEVPAQAEIEKLFDLLGMSAVLARSTANMSGGEKQRLALARALLLNPETMLLDEPTAALDDENARAVFSYLAKWVRKPGKTVVVVSHSGSLINEYGDSILELNGGRISSVEKRSGAHV